MIEQQDSFTEQVILAGILGQLELYLEVTGAAQTTLPGHPVMRDPAHA